mmetsp:Transcript_2743/g.6649  ORF Transcript_2743/g.6649 Transcript_2743/m.6649 type:complete len:230 (-) Transcript_2743:51-740(-)
MVVHDPRGPHIVFRVSAPCEGLLHAGTELFMVAPHNKLRMGRVQGHWYEEERFPHIKSLAATHARQRLCKFAVLRVFPARARWEQREERFKGVEAGKCGRQDTPKRGVWSECMQEGHEHTSVCAGEGSQAKSQQRGCAAHVAGNGMNCHVGSAAGVVVERSLNELQPVPPHHHIIHKVQHPLQLGVCDRQARNGGPVWARSPVWVSIVGVLADRRKCIGQVGGDERGRG